MQFASIRRIRLGELKKECAATESNIQSLEAKLEDIATQVRAEKETLDIKRREMALLSPIYTLPDDVVSEILKVAYSHHFPHCRLDDGLPHTHSPVAVSHVSRWWRAQALSVPSIWTCIHVTPQQPAHYAEVVKAYIVRSRNMPLSISFLCMSESQLVNFEEVDDGDVTSWSTFKLSSWTRFKSSWGYLVTEKHRWKNLALYISYSQVIETIFNSLRHNIFPGSFFPQLEYLRISHNGYGSRSLARLGDTPKLTHLRSDGLLDILESPRSLFRNLTHLSIYNFYAIVRPLLDVLACCAETLTTLVLSEFDLCPVDDTTRESQLTLPRLSTLLLSDICGSIEDDAICTIHILLRSAPALEMLRITGTDDVICIFANEEVAMPSIRYLHLANSRSGAGPELDIHDGEGLFLALPGLQTLHSSNVDILPILQAAIDVDETPGYSAVSWPSLQTLILEHPQLNEDPIVEFVEHRARVNKPIQTLVVAHEEIESFSSSALETFKELNLDLRSLSQMSPEISQGMRPHIAGWWDSQKRSPVFEPWNGSWYFWDQF